MKYIKTISIFLFVIFISSCSVTKKTEKSIIGKWEIVTLENDIETKTSEDYQKMFKELIKGSFIDFKADKTYELFLIGKKQNGNWSISVDGSKIITSTDNVNFVIMNRTEEELKLKSIKDSKSLILFLKRY